jgi:hypothetical protein
VYITFRLLDFADLTEAVGQPPALVGFAGFFLFFRGFHRVAAMGTGGCLVAHRQFALWALGQHDGSSIIQSFIKIIFSQEIHPPL